MLARFAQRLMSRRLNLRRQMLACPAQSSLAFGPAVNVGQRFKSAKTRTDKDCVDIPVAVAIPSDSPSPILSFYEQGVIKNALSSKWRGKLQ